MAGYLAPNIAKNTLIPHGVQMLFKRTGSTSFVDLGDLSDVSLTPTIEFLEYSSNQSAKAAIAKRIGQNKGITIEATINEITPETLRIAFYGDAATASAAGSPEVLTAVEKITIPAGSTGTVAMGILFNAASIVSVKGAAGKVYTGISADGTSGDDADDWFYDSTTPSKNLSLVAVTSPTPTSGGAEIVTDAASADLDLIVEYTYTKAVDKLEIGKEDQQTGIVEFHIRNNEGGLGQVITLDDVHVATSGAIPLAPDAVQNFPITVTSLVKNGTLGHVAYFDV